MLILVTPYLRFESTFVAMEKDELLVQATMNREDAVYGLRTERPEDPVPPWPGLL